VPIGRPISNVRVYVVDDRLEPVPTGGAGELVIGGAAVARGYLGRPGLTAQRFVPDPFGPPGARAYRTGDLCRRRADGAVEFLGRLDTQVKLHGNRIELGEIETALAAHPGVRQCCVILRQLDAGPALVAYLVPGTAAWTPAELRDHLLRSLPPATVPSHYVAIEALPLSTNGKLDRSALPAPGPAPVRQRVAPRIRREEVLAAVWAAVLGTERVGIHDNFFALGGDSLKAVRAVGLARERGVEISVEHVFRHQTVAELAAAAAASTARPRLPEAFELLGQEDGQRTPEDAEDAYPMTMLQAGMLLHMHEGEEIPAYHNVTSMCASARFDSRAMRQAADRLVKRHAALRTSLHVTGFSVPMAVVHRRCRLPVTYEDLRGLEPGEQQAAVTSFMQLQARQPLDVTRAPLLRLHAHVISDDAFWITVTECHPILDGWSFTSSIRELLVAYSAFLDGTEPDAEPASPPYQREFVRREREAMASPAEEEFWNERLRGARPQCLPRWPAPARAEPESHRLYHLILGDLVDGLERLAREAAVPLSSVLLAAHLRVLSLICGGPDVVTGVTVHGRPEVADADAARGLFLNVLPLRCRLDGGTWRELISQAFAGQGELYAHRHYPQAAVQRLWSREHGRGAMFEAGFNYTHFYSMAELGQLSNVQLASAFREIARTNVPLAANFDRSLDEDGAGVVMSLESEAGVISVEQLRRFAELYEAVLRAMTADPDARYEAVKVLGATDAAETAAANLTPAPLPALAAHRMIEEQARSTPALPAVRDRARTLSYRELEAAAAALAARIRERGCGRGAVAGICVGRDVQMAIAVLATLKAGVAYLPLDPALPPKRLERLAARAGAALVLCDRQTLPALAGMAAARLMVEGQADGRLDAGYDWRPDELAYVIYTSGSTGEPKGVAVTQGGLANYLAWAARAYGVREGDRVPVQTQLGFDLTVTSLLVPLVAGGCAEILESVDDLGAALAGGPWSLLKLTPSHLRLLEVAAGELKPGAARLLVVGGESLHGEALQAWRRADPGVQIINEYGPTETVVGCCVHRVPAGALGPVPIGRPIANTQLHVLDGDLLPAPVGTKGELFVGGAGLARGYLGQPGRTSERFMPDPYSGQPGARMYRTGDLVRRLPGGDLEFLDRVDDQVKISGHRVEPAETEAALCEHDAIAAAAVVPFTTATGTRLAAFLVPAGSARAPAKHLRDHLSERLPAPMIPALFAWLDRLPLTANAKLDRAALVRQAAAAGGGGEATPEPAAGLASGPTGDPLVAKITAAWTEVLGPAAGSDADFFELGGDSIAALQIVARLLAGGVQLRPSAIFENPTPRELATSLGMPEAGAPAQPGARSWPAAPGGRD
jgi:amino acid adenylation domain-containing protein